MIHSKRIILFLTSLLVLGMVVQPAYAEYCTQSDPCMPTQHPNHTANTGHKDCQCNPIDNWSNSAACHQEAVYTRLEMAVVRIDTDETQSGGSGFVAIRFLMADETCPILAFGLPAHAPPPLKLPIYLQTLSLLI